MIDPTALVNCVTRREGSAAMHDCLVFILIVTLVTVDSQNIGGALYRCMACVGVLQKEYECAVDCNLGGRFLIVKGVFTKQNFVNWANLPN